MNRSLGVQLFAYPFRSPTTDQPLALGTVTTTLAGTSTLVATFADAALTQPNPNPLTLDPSGYALMFFSPLNGGVAGVSYDVVVKNQAGIVQRVYEDVSVPVPTAGGNLTSAVIGHGTASTLTIAGGSITPTGNVHLVSPEGGAADFLDHIDVSQFPDGGRLTISNTNAAAPITIRNAQTNIFTSDGQNVVLNSVAQRLSFIRYGANFYVDMQVGGGVVGGGSTTNIINAVGNIAATGRLTLVSGVPVPTADVNSANLFYTPYTGNNIDLYDGVSAWQRFTFSELTYPLAGILDGVVFDMFAYNNAGIVALSGTPWASPTTRATALVRQNGVLVNSAQPTLRYLGTVATNGAASCTDSAATRYVWNFYNRVRRAMRRLETTANWEWAVSAYRQANGSALNQLNFVLGVSEDALDVGVVGRVHAVDPEANVGVSIGLDSATTPLVGVTDGGNGLLTPNITQNVNANVVIQVAEGKHALTWLERGQESGATWTGAGTLFKAGLSGTIWN